MNHTIIPLYNGQFSVRYGSQKPIPSILNIPTFCFLVVDGQGHPVLVDTGFGSHYLPGVDSEYRRESDKELDHAIRKSGFLPDDIDTVILTHLHWDHTGDMALFRSARFLVQARELEYVAKIRPRTFDECAFWPFQWLDLLPRFELLHGNTEIKPGLQVIWTGDHTAGHQVVKIQTSAGDVILAGDAPFNYAYLQKDVPEEFWEACKLEGGKDLLWPSDVRPLIRQFLKQYSQLPHQANPDKQPAAELKSQYRHFFTSHDPRLRKIKSIPGKEGMP